MEKKRRVQWRLSEIFQREGISQAEACRRTGISPQQMSKLCRMGIVKAGSDEGIRFDTLEKLCSGLEITLSDLIRIEPVMFLDFVQSAGGRLTVFLGARPSLVSPSGLKELRERGRVDFKPEILHRAMVGHSDVHALAEVISRCPRQRPKIKIVPSLSIEREEETSPIDYESFRGVVVGLGGPLVSGLAVQLLCALYEYYDSPFHFLVNRDEIPKNFLEAGNRRKFLAESDEENERILWRGNTFVEAYLWERIEKLEQGERYPDGCVIVVWPTEGRRAWVVLVMGLKGNGTLAGTFFLFSERFAEILSEYLAYLDHHTVASENTPENENKKPTPPLSVVLKVMCEKRGSGIRDVYPVQTSEGVEVEDVKYEYQPLIISSGR